MKFFLFAIILVSIVKSQATEETPKEIYFQAAKNHQLQNVPEQTVRESPEQVRQQITTKILQYAKWAVETKYFPLGESNHTFGACDFFENRSDWYPQACNVYLSDSRTTCQVYIFTALGRTGNTLTCYHRPQKPLAETH